MRCIKMVRLALLTNVATALKCNSGDAHMWLLPNEIINQEDAGHRYFLIRYNVAKLETHF